MLGYTRPVQALHAAAALHIIAQIEENNKSVQEYTGGGTNFRPHKSLTAAHL